jgi:hypothetical protein
LQKTFRTRQERVFFWPKFGKKGFGTKLADVFDEAGADPLRVRW